MVQSQPPHSIAWLAGWQGQVAAVLLKACLLCTHTAAAAFHWHLDWELAFRQRGPVHGEQRARPAVSESPKAMASRPGWVVSTSRPCSLCTAASTALATRFTPASPAEHQGQLQRCACKNRGMQHSIILHPPTNELASRAGV